MDQQTLFATLVGALIATIPILFSNIVQIFLHVSERRQKEKEARIQAREKWIERDIVKVMESVDNLLAMFSEARALKLRRQSIIEQNQAGLYTDEELQLSLKESHQTAANVVVESNRTFDTISRFVYSFEEDEIKSAFNNLMDSYFKSMNGLETDGRGTYFEDDTSSWYYVKSNAGKFQRALREKLISLRDT